MEILRLRIVPLSVEHFRLFLDETEKMELQMGLTPSREIPDEHTRQAMEDLYAKAIAYPEHYYWYTNWQIILKSENKSIGSACFMKDESAPSQVEIGYGTNAKYRNKGFMTEAVQALCKWALQQPYIKCITAETEINNIPSQRVLEKCKMHRYRQTNESIWWKLEKE
ncbi:MULTISPECIES: GNAT family N-acetyltransferase [unclassified Dysgonomonas]|nr:MULTISPECIES: GNAT family N-acetyltransferase [unclassified Dysgonomonas]